MPCIGKFSGRCNIGFGGADTCQCSLCWELFDGNRALWLHRPGGNAYFLGGQCTDPATLGMELRSDGIWQVKE